MLIVILSDMGYTSYRLFMDKQRGIIERFLYAKCAFSYSLIFLPFISSAFVPTNTIPQVVQAFAKINR